MQTQDTEIPNDPHHISATARKQKLLNMVLLGLAVPGSVFGVAMLVLWAFGRVPISGALAGLGVQPFYLVSYWMSRRGWLRVAAYIPVVAVFLAMIGGSYQMGIGHVTYIGFAMATLAAGILIGPVQGILFAILSTIAHLSIGYVQISGSLPRAINPQTTFIADGIGLGLGLLVIIVFTEIYSREISTALQRERSLSETLKENQSNLEQTIGVRTRDLSRRLVQIRTAAEISRSIGAILEPGQLLSQVVKLIQDRFNLYYVGAFLLDDTGKYAVLRVGTGEPGEKMLAEGHHLTVGGASMIGWAVSHHQARIALDVGDEAVRFNNPHLTNTRSEMALPLLVGKKVLGALSIQSDQPEAFDQDDITVLQGIADSLATALENARLFQQVESNLDEIKSLHRSYLADSWREFAESRGPLHYRYESDLSAANTSAPDTSQSFPVILRDQIIGELTLETDQTDFSPEEVALIEGVINQAAVSLENARLLEEAHRLALREQKINAISNQIRDSVDLETILQNTVRELGSALGSAQAFIQIGLDGSNGAGEKST